MLMRLFEWLTNALYSNPFVSLTSAFIWGILSILLSPCHLSSIPLIVGFMSGQNKLTLRKAFLISLFFSIGILITIGLIGFISGLLGRMLGDIGPFGNIIVALIFFMVGLYLLDILPLPFLSKINKPQFQKRGYLASFILGLIFGIAVGPCTFAYMAPILSVVFKVSSTNFIYAVSLIIFYGIGHCLVIIFAGTFFEMVEKYLHWNEKSNAIIIIKKICGILVILGGIYLILDVVKLLYL